MIPFTPDERRAQFAPSQNAGGPIDRDVLDIIGGQQQPTMVQQVDYTTEQVKPIDPDVLDIANQSQIPLMTSLMGASRVNPDQAAEATRLGSQVGIGQDIALRNMDEVRQRAFMADVQRRDIARANPVLAGFLSDRSFANQASDDIGILEQVGSFFTDVGRAAGGQPMQYIPGELARGFMRGQLVAERGEIGTRAIAGEAEETNYARARQIQEEMRGLAGGGILASTAEVVAQNLAQVREVVGTGLVGGAAGSVIPGIGTMAGITGGLGTGIVLTTAKMEAGNAYLDLQEQGISDDNAVPIALGVGLLNGIIEAAGAKVAAAPFKQLANRVMREQIAEAIRKPTMRAALAAAGKSYVLQVGTEASEEGVQEIVNIAGEELARGMEGIDSETTMRDAAKRVLDAFVQGAMGSAILGGIGPGANLYVDLRKAGRAQKQTQFFNDLSQNASESKLKARDPGAYERFVAATAQGTGADTVFVDAATMRGVLSTAGVTDAQLDAVAPGLSQQVREAAETGNDVTIPTAQFAARLAGTQIGDSLLPHMRLSPDAMSATEAQAFVERRDELVQEAEKLLESKTATEEAFVREADDIRAGMKQQLVAAGRDDLAAEAESAIYQAMVVTAAAREGMTPKQYADEFGMREVIGPGVEPAAAMEQVRPYEQAASDIITAVDDELYAVMEAAKTSSRQAGKTRSKDTQAAAKKAKKQWIATNPERYREYQQAQRYAEQERARQREIRQTERATAVDAMIAQADTILRNAGFELEYQSEAPSKSRYYRKGAQRVRVSDHEIPMTPERQYGRETFGAPWREFVFDGSISDAELISELEEWSRTTPNILEQASRIDAEYMAAVERGDMDTAQRMVDEAAKASGFDVKAFHGSASKPFWVFDPARRGERTGSNSALLGFFASSERTVASQYQLTERERREFNQPTALGFGLQAAEDAVERAYDIQISAVEDKDEGGWLATMTAIDQFGSEYSYDDGFVYETSQEAEEAAETAKQAEITKTQKRVDEELSKYQDEDRELRAGRTLHDLWVRLENPLIYDFKGGSFKDKSYSELVQEAIDEGHDGVIMKNTVDSIDYEIPSDVVVFFASNQAKLADPVTYDESGAVVPLSRRFDITSPRIFEQAAGPQVFEQRPITPGFYSALERELTAIDAKAMAASGWKERLKGLVGKGAIKADELEWTGLLDWIDMQEGKVSKDTVLEFVRSNGVQVERRGMGTAQAATEAASVARDAFFGAFKERYGSVIINGNQLFDDDVGFSLMAGNIAVTDLPQDLQPLAQRWLNASMRYEQEREAETTYRTKYEKYQLPGGTNYREVLLTLPVRQDKPSYQELIARKNALDKAMEFAEGEAFDAMQKEWKSIRLQLREAKQYEYRSTHWDQPNVLVHLRMNDRVDADGKRVLFVEEVQSDWGQAGTKYGFTGQRAADDAELARLLVLQETNPSEALERQVARIQSRVRRSEYNVFRAPFVETTDGWLNLGLKQIMLEAVNGGYDRVAFVNGQQSADRYSLAKKVESLSWSGYDSRGATKLVTIYPLQGNPIELPINDRGVVVSTGNQFDGKELDEIVPKEIADQIMNEPAGELAGNQLEIGGEGMKEFYDSIVPAAMNKLLKKYGGGKIGTVEIDTRTPESEAYYEEPTDADILPQPGFAITLEMLKKMESGLPLFQAARGEPRGGFDPRRMRLFLTKKQDASTAIHELTHFALQMMTNLAATGKASPQVLADLDLLFQWRKDAIAGDTPEARLATWLGMSVDQQRIALQEPMAYNGEIYIFEGKAPTEALQAVFERLRSFMLRVYKSIRDEINAIYRREFGEDLPMLTDEVRGVFDRMLASDADIRRQAAINEMKPSFQTQAESGMDDATWAAYQDMQREATEASITDLTKASLRQMQWLGNARSRILRDMQKKHDATRKEVASEVAAAVRLEPVYRAMNYLRYGKFVDADGQEIAVDGPHKLDRAVVEKMYELEPLTLRPDLGRLSTGKYGILVEGGQNPDMVAELFGYSSGDEMIRAIVAAKPIKEAVDERTDAEMTNRYGDMNTREAQEAAVQTALHNEARARMVAVQYRWTAKLQQPVRVITEAAKAAAQQVIGRKRLRDIRPSEFVAAETRAAREARGMVEFQDPSATAQTASTKAYKAAIEAGRTEEEATQEAMQAGVAAAESQRSKIAEFQKRYPGMTREQIMVTAQRHQLLNNHLARAALDVRDEVDETLKGFRKFFKSDAKIAERRDLGMIMAARAILASRGIGTSTESPAAYTKQLEENNPALYAELAPIIAQATGVTYRDLTVSEFRVLAESVEALWNRARNDRQIQVGDQKFELERVVTELVEAMSKIKRPEIQPGVRQAVTYKDVAKRQVAEVRAANRRMEAWSEAMDGDDLNKPFTTYLWNPIKDSIIRFRQLRNEKIKSLYELVTNLTIPPTSIAAPELGYTFGRGNAGVGKAELLGAMLHTGNESNYRKLLLGRGWATQMPDGTMDDSRWRAFVTRMISSGVLTKADFDFLQSVWDLNEDIKPLLQKAHYDLEGYYFKEVKATPITTPFGIYRGGYVPAATDRFMVADAVERAGMKELEQDWRFSLPSTGMGMTKARVESYTKPLALDVRLVVSHVDSALRFAMIQPSIVNVLKILKNRSFAAELNQIDPTAITGLMLPWLNRSAHQTVSQAGRFKSVDAFWRAVRSRTGMNIMFANLRNAFQQVTGLFPALVKVKPTYLKAAIGTYLSDPRGIANMIAATDPFMDQRMRDQVYEMQEQMNDLLLNPNKFEKLQAWNRQHAYFLQTAFQNQVDIITWLGAYNQSLAESGVGVSEDKARKQAIRDAGSAVRQTQGSVMPEDISAFESGTPFFRTFTQFSGYFNGLANMQITQFVKTMRTMGFRGGKGRLLYIYMMGMAMPALVADAIVKSMGGGWDDDDDDGYLDVYLDWFFGSQIRLGAAFIPFGSTAYQLVTAPFDDKAYNDRMNNSPSIQALESATIGTGKAIVNVLDEDKELTGKNVRDVLTAVTLATGIPVNVVGKPAGYLLDVYRGEIEPEGPYDFVRGLITGTPSPSSRR